VKAKGGDDRSILEGKLASALAEHGLRLTEITYKKNLEKRVLSLGLKVTGDLDEQLVLEVLK
jgi:hypothetical protein